MTLFLCSLYFSRVSSIKVAENKVQTRNGISREASQDSVDSGGTEEARIIASLYESVTKYLQLTGLDDETVNELTQIISEGFSMFALIMEDRTSKDEQMKVVTASNSSLFPPTGFPCNILRKSVCFVQFGSNLCSTFGLCRTNSGGICNDEYFLSCASCVCG